MKNFRLLLIVMIATFSGQVLYAADDSSGDLFQQLAKTSGQTFSVDMQAQENDTFPFPTSNFNPEYLHKTNFKCGLRPLPPLGCRVGACVCDSSGQSCSWTFICN